MFNSNKRHRQNQSQTTVFTGKDKTGGPMQDETPFQDLVKNALLGGSRSPKSPKSPSTPMVRRRSDSTVPYWDDMNEERELSKRSSSSSLRSLAKASLASATFSPFIHPGHPMDSSKDDSPSSPRIHIESDDTSPPTGNRKVLSKKPSSSILRFLGSGKRSASAGMTSPPGTPSSKAESPKHTGSQQQGQSSRHGSPIFNSYTFPQTPSTGTLPPSPNPAVYDARRIVSVILLDDVDPASRSPQAPQSPSFSPTPLHTSPSPPGFSRHSGLPSLSPPLLSGREWEPPSPYPVDDEDSRYYNTAEMRKLSPPPSSTARLHSGGRRGTRPKEQTSNNDPNSVPNLAQTTPRNSI
ncbi:hypothetical protein FRC03_004123 [Tulasnella sp. 419]|nr:hypothetical protein FRC03_004123 [Tulasnella sp. 419]